ncbi:hypothetical protein [Microbacterium sp.]|uniref:hypothetical protein n=1 Tax=Microbacterium sp. TaxID=51671 RepID=UPI003F7135CF
MTSRQLRALRGTAAAAVAVWTASVSHTFGGGDAPSPWIVVVVTVLAAPFAVLLAGRSLSLLRISITVVLAQLLLHVTFALTAGLDPAAGGHVHGAAHALGGTLDLVPDPVMTGAHVIAAIVTILVIARGEWMLRAIAAGLVRLLRPLVVILARTAHAVPAAPVEEPARARTSIRPSDVSRRGPPVVVAAA